MSDDLTKKRMTRAKHRAAQILRQSGYRVVGLSEDPLFDLEASRDVEVRKIKIMLMAPSKPDKTRIEAVKYPASCKKEIWLKDIDGPDFSIIEMKK